MRHSTDDFHVHSLQHLSAYRSMLSCVRTVLERAVWSVTSPRLYAGVAMIAWLGVLFAPQLKELYLQAHPELRRQVVARVASDWGRRSIDELELQMNAGGGEVPSELKLFKPEGVLYLSAGGDEGCIAALIKPRVALTSARCVDDVKPDLASWGPHTGAESVRVIAVEQDPTGALALVKLSQPTPLPALSLKRDLRALLRDLRRVHTATTVSERSRPLQSGRHDALSQLNQDAQSEERLLQRDDLNVVLYLPHALQSESRRLKRRVTSHSRAAMWVPQRSERAPHARAQALEALYAHPGGALVMSRGHALEGIMTAQGLILISTRSAWLEEASEALSTRRITSTLKGIQLRGARPLASRSL